MLLSRALIVATISAMLAAPALAQQTAPTGGPMQGMPMDQGIPGKIGAAPAADFKRSSQASKTVNDRMMQKMDAPLTGDWDWDFPFEAARH
jgi:hypothetical protein